jgi:hypothetical protein
MPGGKFGLSRRIVALYPVLKAFVAPLDPCLLVSPGTCGPVDTELFMKTSNQ